MSKVNFTGTSRALTVCMLLLLLSGIGVYANDDNNGNDNNNFHPSENWKTEVVDDTGWVGIDSCIALDGNGNPHITHYDQRNRDLKYAYRRDGSWQNEIVDPVGDVGEESGIAVDSNGNPHISYKDTDNGHLKYAKKTDGSWDIETVDSTSKYRTVTTSIAVDSNKNPHIAYNMEAKQPSDLPDLIKYAYWDGSLWTIETVTTRGYDVYLALDSNNNPHISYFGGKVGNLRINYATKTSDGWSTKSVDPSTHAGPQNGIAVDSNNNPHIAYRDYGNGAIKYANWDGTQWNIQTVKSGVGSGEEGLRMALDGQDNPHIVYSNGEEELLEYALRDDSQWTIEVISRMGVPSIAIDSRGCPHVSHGHIADNNNDNEGEEREILKYSVRSGGQYADQPGIPNIPGYPWEAIGIGFILATAAVIAQRRTQAKKSILRILYLD